MYRRRRRTRWLLNLSRLLYRLLLLLYPAPFRREFGGEMAQVFGDLSTDAFRCRGVRGLARLWFNTLWDLMVSGLREHLERTHRPHARHTPAAAGAGTPPRDLGQNVTFQVGQNVKVIDGPFAGYIGTVHEIHPERNKVTVLVSFFGRETPVTLDFLQVEKMMPRMEGRRDAGDPDPFVRDVLHGLRTRGRAQAEYADRVTGGARQVLRQAREEALRLNHSHIGPEHLLLGLVHENEGVVARVLEGLEADPQRIRNAVEFIIGRDERPRSGEVGLTPRAWRVLDLAIEEAQRLGQRYIGTEHLLLGLVREGQGIAASVLQSQGIDLRRVREETYRVQSGRSRAGSRPRDMRPGADRRDFDRFDQRARRVLSLAQEEAQRFHHDYIGTEHLLLGLIHESDGVAARVLRRLGVSLDEARQRVEHIIGQGDRIVLGEIGLTPRAKVVIKLAADEAQRMGHSYVGTEHLLLGLIREGEGVAASVLETLGVDLGRARAETLRALEERGDHDDDGDPKDRPGNP